MIDPLMHWIISWIETLSRRPRFIFPLIMTSERKWVVINEIHVLINRNTTSTPLISCILISLAQVIFDNFRLNISPLKSKAPSVMHRFQLQFNLFQNGRFDYLSRRCTAPSTMPLWNRSETFFFGKCLEVHYGATFERGVLTSYPVPFVKPVTKQKWWIPTNLIENLMDSEILPIMNLCEHDLKFWTITKRFGKFWVNLK